MQPDEGYSFGPFSLDTARLVLLRGSDEVRLRPKALETLLVLLRNPGRVVSKDELVEAVWPDVIVNDDALAQCVRDVRKAIEDTDGSYIRTVARRGYMFVHPVVAGGAPGTGQGLEPQITANSDAHRSYLLGRQLWSRRSEAGWRDAIRHFQSAIALDRGFAAAYAAIADCYVSMGKASNLPPAEAFPAAKWHAQRAVELDPRLFEPLASLGFVSLYFEWDWPAADRQFQQAIALGPTYSVTREWYSVFLMATGRKTEGLKQIQLALRIDPLSPAINSTLAFHHYHSGRYDEAAKQFAIALEMSRDFPPARFWLGRTYQELGQFEEAIREFRWIADNQCGWPVAIAALGHAAGIAGRRTEAIEALEELHRLSATKYVTSYCIALVHAGLGDRDSAFAALFRAFEERSNWMVWLRHDPRWTPLRDDARFSDLVTRIGFPPRLEASYEA